MKKYLFIGTLVLCAGVFLLLRNEKKLNDTPLAHTKISSAPPSALQSNGLQKIKSSLKNIQLSLNQKSQSSSQQAAPSIDQQKNLKAATDILYAFSRPNADLKNLVSLLEKNNQQPQVYTDKNPHTGEMTVVRTNSPFPGSRYFHAQHFADNSENGLIQHVSFEFQPSPTAMSDAISVVKNTFKLAAPQVQRDGYAKWDIGNHQILWIKRMTSEDLKPNPYNAYTQEDAGTVRVAVEQEIHDIN